MAAEHRSDLLAGEGLQTHEGVSSFLLVFPEYLTGCVKGHARITLDIHDAAYLDLRKGLKSIAIAS